MFIAVNCPCGRDFEIKAELAGSQVYCPSCDGVLVVPQPEPPIELEVVEEEKPQACELQPDPQTEFEVVEEEKPQAIPVPDEEPKQDWPRKTRRRADRKDDREKPNPWWWQLLALVPIRYVVGSVLILLVVYVLVYFAYYRHNDRAFQKHLIEYLNPGPTNGIPQSWAVNGKIVVVDEEEEAISSLHFDLPRSVRASGPDEVEAVVHLRWKTVIVGQYFSTQTGAAPDEAKAYCWVCHFKIYDWKTRQLLSEGDIKGPPPPGRIDRLTQGTGQKPTKQVVNFLADLPGKKLR